VPLSCSTLIWSSAVVSGVPAVPVRLQVGAMAVYESWSAVALWIVVVVSVPVSSWRVS
jgi:hypothetical protein